jgi:hypothetical protein
MVEKWCCNTVTVMCYLVATLQLFQFLHRVVPGSVLHCCYTVITLLLHCCHTVGTLLVHCSNVVVTLLLISSYTVFTVVTLLLPHHLPHNSQYEIRMLFIMAMVLHCCHTVVTVMLH